MGPVEALNAWEREADEDIAFWLKVEVLSDSKSRFNLIVPPELGGSDAQMRGREEVAECLALSSHQPLLCSALMPQSSASCDIVDRLASLLSFTESDADVDSDRAADHAGDLYPKQNKVLKAIKPEIGIKPEEQDWEREQLSRAVNALSQLFPRAMGKEDVGASGVGGCT